VKNKKICLVGGGNWGKNHLKTLNELGALGGLVDTNKDILSRAAKKFPDIYLYNDLNDALLNDVFDGFSVATPAETHYEVAKKILYTKKPVLIEKPFVLNIKHAEELVEIANKDSLTLMVGHLLLFHPAIRKIKELIDGKRIGDLKYIYSNRLNFGKIRSEENVFWSLAPHDISLFQFFTNSFPLRVESFGSNIIQNQIDDSSLTIFEYPNGIKCHLFVSWIHPFKEHRLVFIGTKGMLSFEDSSDQKQIIFHKKRFEKNNEFFIEATKKDEIIKYQTKMPLTEQYRYFIDHLNTKQPLIANGKHALDVTKILIKASV